MLPRVSCRLNSREIEGLERRRETVRGWWPALRDCVESLPHLLQLIIQILAGTPSTKWSSSSSPPSAQYRASVKRAAGVASSWHGVLNWL
jgi:hypothetical protein